MSCLTFYLYLLLVLAGTDMASAGDYHVDADHGSDQNTGLSRADAWKTLDPVNAKVFQPGDRVLLKAGTRCSGSLVLKGSGSIQDGKPVPIELASYGDGPAPRIDANGLSPDALLLKDSEYWIIRDIELTNHGEVAVPWRTGVRIESAGGKPLHFIHLSNLYVHDVNGDLHKEKEGCGIFFDSRGKGSCFDDFLVEKCHVVRTDRNGICQRTLGGDTRSTHVVIRENQLEDIGGDGIKLWGTNGGLVELNTLRGGRMRCDDYAAGIWPFDSDNCIIQSNEVSGMKGTRDGQGFDSDYICKNNIFQYNYSHNNDGGFMLLCSPGDSHCDGTIVRYNISQNDGKSDSAVFHIAGNVTRSTIYNNLIYLGPKQDVPLLDFGDWKGYAHRNSFFNNIFYVDGKATYKWGKSTQNIFDSNLYYGNHVGRPKDDHAITDKPPLLDPGKGGDGFNSLAGYGLIKNAEMPRGRFVPDNGGRDFFGNLLPSDSGPTVGVAQRPFFIP